ncbi:NUDIX hydrolase [Parafrankia elaeagni]|uniref:NUDIX hydrolase n=1 Tax=Parafrankia elaeagni TaxID=222534 RepID=UPI000376DF48|nr:NUDIX domain-containing protein [Parafrankia elaeagni]
MTTPTRRDTARIILAGPDDRLLLFRHHLPEPWAQEGWLTPGGAIDPGESPAQTALRELAEETGHLLSHAEIGRPIALDSGEWHAHGSVFVTTNWYFFSRTTSSDIDLSGQDDDERRDLLEHRWWSVVDLHTTGDLIFPVGLAGLAGRLLAGDLPLRPIRLPWT